MPVRTSLTLLAAALFLLVPGAAAQDQEHTPVRTFERYRADARAPQTDTLATVVARPGHVVVEEGPAITKLMADYRERPLPRQGYRVQIHLGDRTMAEERKRLFLQHHPEVPAYLSWLAPNFRLRVGDLRTRLEAERLLGELREQFPGSYVVPDEIEMPRTPE